MKYPKNVEHWIKELQLN